MFPLIATLALAFLSFFASVFVLLRILIPILPPHPLSKRVSPSEFGLPNYRPLTPADKTHLWLTCCDLLALALFLWHVFAEAAQSPALLSDSGVALDPLASGRLWLSLNLRQTCLTVASCITLYCVRKGRSVSFGTKHWLLWIPAFSLIIISTVFACVFASLRFETLFLGLVTYSSVAALASSAALVSLVVTLLVIRKNISALNEPRRQTWEVQSDKPRPSFATEDIDALKDGSSWLTSNSSDRRSVSSFSFTTERNSTKASTRQDPAAPRPKSSFWFRPPTPEIPPVPPIPSIYRPTSPTAASIVDDGDPFRRDDSHVHTLVHEQRTRMGSQTSWLTSTSGSHTTVSAWSYPTTAHGRITPGDGVPEGDSERLFHNIPLSPPQTPRTPTATGVLGGYGWDNQAEKGFSPQHDLASKDLDVSILRTVGWLTTIWFPFICSLPYLFTVSFSSSTSEVFGTLLVLSVTLSSPLLALNIIFRSPIPIPTHLFDTASEPPASILRSSSPVSTLLRVHDYKRSGSLTLVDEGRRSGDVWVKKGDAAEGRSKFERAVGLLQPVPQLAVMPVLGDQEMEELSTPLPLQEPGSPMNGFVSSLEVDGQQNFSHDTTGKASLILVAQRHYSALATTVVIPPTAASSTNQKSRRMPSKSLHSADLNAHIAGSTGVSTSSRCTNQHLRTRSVSSTNSQNARSERPWPPPTPPPCEPLPPTPTKAQLHWNELGYGIRMTSSGNANADRRQIDALSAKLLPRLVPGLTVGPDMKIKNEFSPSSPTDKASDDVDHRRNTCRPRRSRFPHVNPWESGSISSFETPEIHSTPARTGAKQRQHEQLDFGFHVHGHVQPSTGALNDLAIPEEVGSAPSSQTRFSERDDPWSARSSLATLLTAVHEEVNIPFNPTDGSMSAHGPALEHDSGPLAESTPQYGDAFDSGEQSPPVAPYRRSSILYIKSDGPSESNPNDVKHTFAMRSPVHRPNQYTMTGSQTPGKGRGLKPLSLLKARDLNQQHCTVQSGDALSKTQPLALSKKKRDANSDKRELKSMKLLRSASAKARGLLRQEEILPDVVVRPPSSSQHHGFVYSFES